MDSDSQEDHAKAHHRNLRNSKCELLIEKKIKIQDLEKGKITIKTKNIHRNVH